eukprot:TRINITY_DN8385_c0_g1_i1.p1 TRINITY_DN8385_c0_g1~~TRINITY_DN8385_c0_g1_i1.p1  ORF type:complete len:217 (+),score=40.59 TRINITY_DN8385_c0_g1_i1:180-830(+)
MKSVFFVLAFVFAAVAARELAQIGGQSFADAASLATGLQTFSDSFTFNVDNANFSSAIASGQFATVDPTYIAGGTLSQAGVQRTLNGSQTAVAAGFANSLLLGLSTTGAGVAGQGASAVEAAATPTEAGLNATAATVAAVNGPGTLLWQNQAGGLVNTTANGPAAFNFTTRYNATGVNPSVAELVNVRLVSNDQETGSALTICVGNSTNCGTVVNP